MISKPVIIRRDYLASKQYIIFELIICSSCTEVQKVGSYNVQWFRIIMSWFILFHGNLVWNYKKPVLLITLYVRMGEIARRLLSKEGSVFVIFWAFCNTSMGGMRSEWTIMQNNWSYIACIGKERATLLIDAIVCLFVVVFFVTPSYWYLNYISVKRKSLYM